MEVHPIKSKNRVQNTMFSYKCAAEDLGNTYLTYSRGAGEKQLLQIRNISAFLLQPHDFSLVIKT